ncbi:hypothetical protein L1987_72533 [Smallanthus sonchifolius]|uniref:Uncharacterized protein n=1 Tax=Smallanthus sonchifolius TaxID=185202 RepID=A0ACB9AVG6_9ASTR|nr:hypothetical protein L1987_72533 [Smallanthus sonchifolius]
MDGHSYLEEKALDESTRVSKDRTPKTLSAVTVRLLRRRCAPSFASSSLFTALVCHIVILFLTSVGVGSRPQHR